MVSLVPGLISIIIWYVMYVVRGHTSIARNNCDNDIGNRLVCNYLHGTNEASLADLAMACLSFSCPSSPTPNHTICDEEELDLIEYYKRICKIKFVTAAIVVVLKKNSMVLILF